MIFVNLAEVCPRGLSVEQFPNVIDEVTEGQGGWKKSGHGRVIELKIT